MRSSAPDPIAGPRSESPHDRMVEALLAGEGFRQVAAIASELTGAEVEVLVPRPGSEGSSGSETERFAAGVGGARAAAPVLDLEHLSGAEEEALLGRGEVTSVQLVEAYAERITALNKSGPGLNAVTQINPDVIAEAEKTDQLRAEGKSLGPAMGLPILLKDIIDATPMYTSAGDWALRDSFPEKDSGVAKELRAHGVVILGKLGLS
jgi:hypothetical protein